MFTLGNGRQHAVIHSFRFRAVLRRGSCVSGHADRGAQRRGPERGESPEEAESKMRLDGIREGEGARAGGACVLQSDGQKGRRDTALWNRGLACIE